MQERRVAPIRLCQNVLIEPPALPRDRQRSQHAVGRRFGGGRPADHHHPHDEHDERQAGQQVAAAIELLAQRHDDHVAGRLVRVGKRPQHDVAGEQDGEHHSRQDARQEHFDDRHLRRHRIDHHDDRRRQQYAERAGPAQRAEAGPLIVAAALELGQRDLGDGRAGRGGRARNRAEERAPEYVDVHQAPRQPGKPRRQALEHLLRQPGAVEDFAHPHEERQRRQGPGCAGSPERLEQAHLGRRAGEKRETCPPDRRKSDRDPHATDQQYQQEYQQQPRRRERRHYTVSVKSPAALRSSSATR